MADVKITFEEVKTKANEIHTCNVNLDQALKDIKTNITSLDAQWTSDAWMRTMEEQLFYPKRK